jgi:DNA repair exonuclease SbcCD ATPase subunit
VVRQLKDGIIELNGKAESLFDEAESKLDALNQRWQAALKPLEEAINKIKREAQTESLDPDRLLKLAEEKATIEPLIEELEGAQQGLNQLIEERRNHIRDVRDRRLNEHKLRRERASEIGGLLRGRLRLQVEFKGMKERYKSQLQSAVRGSGLTQDAIDRLVAPDATDGIALAESIRAGSADLQKKFGVTAGMADRLVSWGSADESRLFELEGIMPTDVLRVELEVDGQYRSLDRLSAGQRATAVLLLLFALEGRVMVLDQPEDDLDNRFVYEDVVQMLRDQKGLKDHSKRRQVIAASHNANIPVLGDAELVVPLEVENGRARISHAASIDDTETRELVKKVMEGGEEAFMLRAQKYGGIRLS